MPKRCFYICSQSTGRNYTPPETPSRLGTPSTPGCSERRRVQVPQDKRHRELGHRQEERAQEGDGHHQVEVHEQIAPQLRESLDDGRADHADAGILSQGPGHVAGVCHLSQLLDEAVSVLGGLASALSQVGHHGMRRVSAQRHRPLRPRAPQPPRIQRRQQRRAVVQIPSLDVLLGGGLDELQRERIPDVPVVVAVARARELLPESGELGVRVVGGGLRVHAPRRLADEREPLLSLPSPVRAHEVLLLPQQDLIRHRLDVRRPVGREGGVAREPRVPTIGATGDVDRVPREATSLGVVQRSPGGAGGGEPSRPVREAVELLPDLGPDAVGAHEDVGVGLRAVLEGGDDAASATEVFVGRDARLDPDGALGEAVLDQDLLDDGTVHDDRGGQAGLQRRTDRVESHQPISRVVQSRELVPLPIPDLEPAHAIGGARPRGHELLVDLGVDPLQRPQRVRLDLDGPAVRRVRPRLLEEGHLHPLRVTRRRDDQPREASPRHEDGQRIVVRHVPSSLRDLPGRSPPRPLVLLAHEHPPQGPRVLARLPRPIADPLGPLDALGRPPGGVGALQHRRDVRGNVDFVRRGGVALGEPRDRGQLRLGVPEEGRGADGRGLLADDAERGGGRPAGSGGRGRGPGRGGRGGEGLAGPGGRGGGEEGQGRRPGARAAGHDDDYEERSVELEQTKINGNGTTTYSSATV
ncbi:hypothetical protein ACHAWF_006580 [Thalassiosira exigua]